MKSLDVDVRPITIASGLRLDYVERGRGPTILFVHGYPDSWYAYEPSLRRMPTDVRAVAFSQRGFGDSDRPAFGYTMADLAADAAAFMDAVDIAEATVVGHSMGSLVAQELALSYPERVSGLVLVGASANFDNPVVREVEAAVRQLGDVIPREFVEEFQASTVHRKLPADFTRGLVSENMKAPPHVWRDALAGILAFRSSDRLARLTVPTLIVGGDRDEIAPIAGQRELHQKIRGSRFLCYEGTGHSPNWEEPQRFVDDLLAFVRGTTRAARSA
jgi:pimeloyl-ACP methyl ester carboxylesterase